MEETLDNDNDNGVAGIETVIKYLTSEDMLPLISVVEMTTRDPIMWYLPFQHPSVTHIHSSLGAEGRVAACESRVLRRLRARQSVTGQA